jgi:type II secretory pathway pseudopilin PulG
VPAVRASRPGPRLLRGSGLVLLVLLIGFGAMVPWWLRRLGLESRAAAADGVAALYGDAGATMRVAARAFVRGDSTGLQYLDAHEELGALVEARIDSAWGTALDDSSRWPEASRRLVQAAATRFAAGSLFDGRFSLMPSQVAGCQLDAGPTTTTVRDAVPRDNCWWQLSGARQLTSPIEYQVEFRIPQPPSRDAGLGLAWCARAADCRVVFVWSSNAVEWASHLPQTGRTVLQSGRPISLGVGLHRLRMRDEDGVVTIWLDGQKVLGREASREAAWLERPGSVHVVVQNMTVVFPRPDPVAVVGVRRSRIE